MRIFVYEYLSSGAVESAASSLRTEGWAMLSAVLEDLARCPDVQASTLLDPRLRIEAKQLPANIVAHFPQARTEEHAFRALASAADWSLVIAPESDDILARRCLVVEEVGGRLLGPSLNASRWSADKVLLNQHWQALRIPAPRSRSVYPLVYKPRFGAGSQATFLIHNEDELSAAERQAREEGWHDEMMRQPHAVGLPVSVAFLAGPEQWHALPAVEQRLSSDGRFRYVGGCLPLSPLLDCRARALAERAARTVEGWLGWFGVDLILGEAEDGSDDVVIEINPRLTTSYVGLRRLARFNLAEAMLAVVTGSPLPAFRWHSGPIVFSADGRIPS
jgi:predicted ATP-grasp superfamily ATP-dependent carboligase